MSEDGWIRWLEKDLKTFKTRQYITETFPKIKDILEKENNPLFDLVLYYANINNEKVIHDFLSK